MTKQAPSSELPQKGVSGKSLILPNSFIQRVIQYIGKEEIRQKLNEDVIDPLLNHIMKRVFPYIILTCVLFILLLVVVLLTLGIIIFHLRNPVVSVIT
jgi:hypothetical protein